jgi:HAMP domain-containing protein
VRVYVAPLAEFGGKAAGGAVIVAASTRDLGETVASLRLISVLAALVAAILAAGPVALLMRRALRPIGQLADAASEIERTGDPRRRLPEYPAADEVGRLGKTLNAMLASLEHSRDAERRFLADASHELRTPLTAKAQLVPASTGRRRDASASAPSKKAIIQTSLCPPPAKSRASIGFQPTKAAANAGIGAATTAKPTTTSIPTAASNRYVKAVVSAERPVAVARPAEAAEKTGP